MHHSWKVRSRLAIASAAVTAAIALPPSPAAHGAVIARDDFESYTLDDNVAGLNGGSGWTSVWSAMSGITVAAVNAVSAPSLGYTVANSGITISGGAQAMRLNVASVVNGNDNIASRGFTTVSSGPLYFRFLLKQVNGQEALGTSSDFFQSGATDSNPDSLRSGAFVSANANNSYTMQARLTAGSTGSTSVFSGGTFMQDTTYLVVGKIDKVNSSTNFNQLTLYLNPTTMIETANATLTTGVLATGTTALNNFFIRLARTEATDTFLLDEIVFGSDWLDVVPEPSGATLALAAAGLGLRRRRRRVANRPPPFTAR